MNSTRSKKLRLASRGFTLIELLVVISIIGILAALLMPVLARAKAKARQTHCINNLKQLGAGMMMYLDENNGTFPGLASRGNGYHPEDWIYWRTNAALYPPVEKSPIVRSLGSANRSLFRCPADKSDADRILQDVGGDGPYLFSYSLTGYGMGGGAYGLDGDVNYGMASVFDGTHQKLFKQSDIRNPSQKIMLAEEPGSTAANDNPDVTGAVILDGRWMPDRDKLTLRHSGKADVTFADGHNQSVDWRFGMDPANSRPDM